MATLAPRLIVSPGTLDEQVFDLKDGRNTVGRTPENDIAIPHRSLSRHHARFDVRADGVFLHDLESKNGTLVDGGRILSFGLGASHKLTLGDVTVLYEAEPGARRVAESVRPAPALTLALDSDVTRMDIRELLRGPGAPRERSPAASRADRDRDKLRILLKVAQLLGSPTSLDALLASILALASEILDIDRAAILMPDPATGALAPRVFRSRSGGTTPSDASFSATIARHVMEHGEAALFSDVRADPRLTDGGSAVLSSICTSMCAPLKPHDEPLGVLYVDNRTTPNRFDAEDLEFLSAFASQAAVAIENTLLSARLAEEAVARKSLLRFFPPAVVPAMMKAGGSQLATVEAEATLLFSDISAFTEMSSRMRPVEVIALLNRYFPVMAEIVFRLEGTLEKYIGDALLAAWGVPVSHEDDAVRAVRAAIEMQRAARKLSESLGEHRPIGIHIGINTGFVAAGNIGSAEYVQYATIGDTTNVAARICSVAATGEVVIDAKTAARARAGGIELVSLGLRPLRGKAEPVELFRVVVD